MSNDRTSGQKTDSSVTLMTHFNNLLVNLTSDSVEQEKRVPREERSKRTLCDVTAIRTTRRSPPWMLTVLKLNCMNKNTAPSGDKEKY